MDSPLLFPVKLKEDKIIVFDETKLPFKESEIVVGSLNEALEVLGSMKTRSLGQVFLFFYACFLWPDITIDEMVKKFKERRPTFDFSMLGEILKKGVQNGQKIKEAVESFINHFDQARKKRAKELANILPKKADILTICNVNGELIYLYEELKNLGKKAIFYVCETRPYLQGTRLTFWELRKNNIPAKLICDNQTACLMQKGKVNCVVTGSDRATTNGDIINKIGTYSLARLANYFNLPFYSLTQYPRDIDIESIEIEERPPNEVYSYLEVDASDLDAVYPCFDVTKAEFVTKCLELKL